MATCNNCSQVLLLGKYHFIYLFIYVARILRTTCQLESLWMILKSVVSIPDIAYMSDQISIS